MYPLLLKTYNILGEPAVPVTNGVLDTGNTVYMLKSGGEGENLIKNGEYICKGLESIIGGMLADAGKPLFDLPVTIKLLNTTERQPVKVYPDDEYAHLHGESAGKISLIYIADCKKGAEMVYGLSRNVTPDELKTRVQNSSLSAICNFVSVQKGDIFFIPPGVIFAIGGGITAIEITNNSDNEYLISDYGRLDENGKPRPLQINRALDVMKTRKNNLRYGNTGDLTLYPFGTIRELGVCDIFKTDLITMDGNIGIYEDENLASIILISGELDMSYPDGTMHLKAGNSVLLPAKVRIKLSGRAEVIYTKI